MQSVYLLLTKPATVFSKLIHFATAEEYTHISLSIDPELRAFYSFGRKYPRFPFPAGLITERLNTGFFGRHPYTKCQLLELKVSDDIYAKIAEQTRKMLSEAHKYKYNMLGILFSVMDIDVKHARHFFCSHFVGEILSQSGAAALPKPAVLMHPNDFASLPQLAKKYSGDLYSLMMQMRYWYCAPPEPNGARGENHAQ